MIVRATSLGDVHTMMLYPVMSSHREISPRHRQRMGIRDNLVRLSAGIEAVEDILEDLEQASAAWRKQLRDLFWRAANLGLSRLLAGSGRHEKAPRSGLSANPAEGIEQVGSD